MLPRNLSEASSDSRRVILRVAAKERSRREIATGHKRTGFARAADRAGLSTISEKRASTSSRRTRGISEIRYVGALLSVAAVLAIILIFSALGGDPSPGDAWAGWAVQDTPFGAVLANVGVFLALPAVEAAVWLVGALVAARTRNWSALVVALLVLAALEMNPVLKELIARPRPAADELIIRRAASGYGFPSGHTEAATLLYGFAVASLAMAASTRIAALCLALAASAVALIGFERIYDGAHWPSDVAGGFVIGLLLLAACWTIGQLLVSCAERVAPVLGRIGKPCTKVKR